jgi:hypothetical protein
LKADLSAQATEISEAKIMIVSRVPEGETRVGAGWGELEVAYTVGFCIIILGLALVPLAELFMIYKERRGRIRKPVMEKS